MQTHHNSVEFGDDLVWLGMVSYRWYVTTLKQMYELAFYCMVTCRSSHDPNDFEIMVVEMFHDARKLHDTFI